MQCLSWEYEWWPRAGIFQLLVNRCSSRVGGFSIYVFLLNPGETQVNSGELCREYTATTMNHHWLTHHPTVAFRITWQTNWTSTAQFLLGVKRPIISAKFAYTLMIYMGVFVDIYQYLSIYIYNIYIYIYYRWYFTSKVPTSKIKLDVQSRALGNKMFIHIICSVSTYMVDEFCCPAS